MSYVVNTALQTLKLVRSHSRPPLFLAVDGYALPMYKCRARQPPASFKRGSISHFIRDCLTLHVNDDEPNQPADFVLSDGHVSDEDTLPMESPLPEITRPVDDIRQVDPFEAPVTTEVQGMPEGARGSVGAPGFRDLQSISDISDSCPRHVGNSMDRLWAYDPSCVL